MMRIAKDLAHAIFNSIGFEVTRLRNGHPYSPTLRPWIESDAVRTELELPRRHSIVAPESMFMLMQWLDVALAAAGDVAEFGVWRGGTALLLHQRLASCAADRTLHLFDSFAGLPEANPARDNHHRKGDFADTSETEVRALFRDAVGVDIHPGLFEETATEVADRRFCFAHIDADLYSSVRFASEFIFPRLSRGGVIVYDDYGLRSCAGAKAAVDEFFAASTTRPVYLPTGQCIAIKI
jgi:O-methyltransferase